jgi:hypothetical protein
MKGIYAFLAGLASAIGLAWLYDNNQQFRDSVDSTRDRVRTRAQSAAGNVRDAAQSAGGNFQRNTSAAADAARRAVFTRASRRSQSRPASTGSGQQGSGIDLNGCSREDLVGAGLSDELADKVLENRPYRNKLDLVSRLVIPEADYEIVKHVIFVDDQAATNSVNVAS